jgi:hypothetical protein
MSYATPRAREIEGFCRELVRYLPGYRGYKLKQSRKRDDKRLRTEISRRLLREASRLEAVEKDAYLAGLKISAATLAESRRKLLEASDVVRFAPYGDSRFFDDDSVPEIRLRGLQEADLELFQTAECIIRCISKLEQPDLPQDEREYRVRDLGDFVDKFCLAFEGREGILAEGW